MKMFRLTATMSPGFQVAGFGIRASMTSGAARASRFWKAFSCSLAGLCAALQLGPLSAYAQVSENALLCDQFVVEISGFDIPQEAIRAVVIGDIRVDLVSTGSQGGQENFAPGLMRYGNLRIWTRDSTRLSEWLTRSQSGRMGPATVSVILQDGAGKEALRYNLFEVVPVSVTPGRQPGIERMVAKVAKVSLEGEGGFTLESPGVWEWAGMHPTSSLSDWQDGPVSITTAGDGSVVKQEAAGGANYWEFSAQSLGVQQHIWQALETLRQGTVNRGVHSRILRDSAGRETGRRNFFDVFISHYSFPVLRRYVKEAVSEKITFLSTQVEAGR